MEGQPPHRVAGFNTLELAAGIIVFAAGVVVALESLSYPMGSLRNVGPGIFPLLLGLVLAALGLVSAAIATSGPSDWVVNSSMEAWLCPMPTGGPPSSSTDDSRSRAPPRVVAAKKMRPLEWW